MVVWFSDLHTGRLYPQKIFLVLTSVIGLVESWAVVRPEGFCQLQIPVTPLEIEPATFRLVEHLTKLKYQIAVFVRVTELWAQSLCRTDYLSGEAVRSCDTQAPTYQTTPSYNPGGHNKVFI